MQNKVIPENLVAVRQRWEIHQYNFSRDQSQSSVWSALIGPLMRF